VLEDDGSYYATHSFEGTAGETLAIELSSDDFDAYLMVRNSQGETIATDDDGAEGTNSLLVISLSDTGSYTVVVNTVAASEIGQYRLEWRTATAVDQDLALASQLTQQVNDLYGAGRSGEAIPLAERALAIREAQLGAEHPDTASSLNNLASLYESMGRYREAEPLYKRALAIREAQLGAEHPDTASSLNNLASLYESMGRYGEAEPLYKRALAINEAQLGPEHPSTATSLNNLAGLYQSMGRYGEAEPLYKRALAIYEAQLGPEHPDTANSLSSLAGLYQSMGRYGEAELLYKRALAIYEAQLGAEHPDTANSLNNLAGLYRSMGRYGEAEPLYKRALAIYEAQLGAEHPFTAISLSGLAGLYQSMGRYEEAEPLYKRALAINEEQLGAEHPDTAASLNSLAALYESMGRYGEAEPLYKRALAISESQLGAEHPDTAISLSSLAGLYRLMGRYGEAEPLYKRALAISESQLGPEHPSTATSLNNLAALYQAIGRYEEAEPLLKRALAIREAQLGAEHPSTATSLNNLAALYWAQRQLQPALSYLQQGLTAEETVLSRNLLGGSDANKRDYLSTVAGSTDGVISLHLNALPTHAGAAHLALTTLLQRKGRILDLFTNLRAQLADDPAAVALFDDLSTANTQFSNLTFNPPPTLSAESIQAQLQALQQQITTLEDQLSRRSAQFAGLTASPNLDAIQAQLSAGTALVEFIRYQPYNPTAAKPSERYGAYHYAAYVLRPNGTIQGMDLGAATAIDAAVRTLATSLSSADTPLFQVKQDAQALDALVMAPVRTALGTTTTVFLSPDGALNLIPFEALVDASGQYLVESYQFRYLTSGRDLMRIATTPASTQAAVLMGNPTYGRPGALVTQANPNPPTRSIDFTSRIFPLLEGTQAEVDRITPLLLNSLVYTQTRATEAALKQQVEPSILHIATHGFFEPNDDPTANPLLQSGLILAGAGAAGRQSGPEQDGILTALEVTGLHLRGTQLVVLSACQTGLGVQSTGEGLYGLRRALVLAGAQSQVISLWKVDDEATQALMVDYYKKLQSGINRDAALRQTQLEFLGHPEYEHPYYWAAFIGSGDWHPLTLK